MKLQAREGTARSFMWLLIFAGVFGLATQFFPGLGSMALLAGIPLLGSLVATSQIFDEREERLLNQAFSTAFQWTSFTLFVFFALYESLIWMNAGDNLIQFVQQHWIGLVFSVMILFLGVAGLPLFARPDAD